MRLLPVAILPLLLIPTLGRAAPRSQKVRLNLEVGRSVQQSMPDETVMPTYLRQRIRLSYLARPAGAGAGHVRRASQIDFDGQRIVFKEPHINIDHQTVQSRVRTFAPTGDPTEPLDLPLTAMTGHHNGTFAMVARLSNIQVAHRQLSLSILVQGQLGRWFRSVTLSGTFGADPLQAFDALTGGILDDSEIDELRYEIARDPGARSWDAPVSEYRFALERASRGPVSSILTVPLSQEDHRASFALQDEFHLAGSATFHHPDDIDPDFYVTPLFEHAHP